MFKCKACIEKDKRISDLQAQIQFLQRLWLPTSSHTQAEAVQIMNNIPNREANNDELANYKKIKQEEIEILSGTY